MTCIQTSWVAQQHPGFFRTAGAPPMATAITRPLPSRPGDGTLPAGQALTVRVREAGVLRITQGRIWLTFSHADRNLRVPAGDHFFGAGEELTLSAGDTVVMECWSRESQACFSWEPARPASARAGLLAAGGGLLQTLRGLRWFSAARQGR